MCLVHLTSSSSSGVPSPAFGPKTQEYGTISHLADRVFSLAGLNVAVSPGAARIVSPGAAGIVSPGAAGIVSPGATGIVSPGATGTVSPGAKERRASYGANILRV